MAAVSGVELPVVSVVVSTHNGARHVAQTIRCVLAQDFTNFEIVVVDDGSTDDTVNVVQGFVPHVRLIQQANQGVSTARNQGLRASQGRYVCFLDQDDFWHPAKLRLQAAVLDAHPEIGAVVCPYQVWTPGTGMGTDAEALAAIGPSLGQTWVSAFSGWVYHQFLLDCWALTSATMLRRSAVQACGGFDTTLPFSEDWDLWLRLSLQWQFAMLPWPPVLYRQHAVQGSRRVRARDFRAELLLGHASRHGLASRDGRALTRWQFDNNLAKFRMQFAYHHLQFGDRRFALGQMWRLWLAQPYKLKWLAASVAATIGWRPAAQGPTT